MLIQCSSTLATCFLGILRYSVTVRAAPDPLYTKLYDQLHQMLRKQQEDWEKSRGSGSTRLKAPTGRLKWKRG